MRLDILIVVTHLLGAGHLVRASAIGRALARRGHRVTLVSGGTPTALAGSEGMDVVQNPPVRSAVGDFTTLLDGDGRPVSPASMEERRRLLVSTFHRTRPQVVITELFPFGRRVLAAEFQALLDAVSATDPAPLLLASVRDILAAPSKPDRVERTHALVARRYAGVLVHGDPAIVPLERSWPVDAALRAKLHYTGYVGPEGRAPVAGGTDAPTVLVSGGSSAAALPLYRAALAAARLRPGRPWHVLVGLGVDEAAFDALRAEAPANALVERARKDFRNLLAEAAVFVGQAGYNTIMDIVATRARAVLVPFEQGRETEQRLRAEGLAASGAATLLPEEGLTPSALAEAVDRTAGRARPAFALALDGQERSADIVERLMSQRPGSDAEAAQ